MKTTIIAVANQKGGVGKTTLVVSLAHAFADLGLKVLVVDTDFQANTSDWLGVASAALKSKRTIAAAIASDLPFTSVLSKTENKNIDVVSAEMGLVDVQDALNGKSEQFYMLNGVLLVPELAQYQVVLIDTHPNVDALFESVMGVSHYYLVPVFAEKHPLQGIFYQSKRIERIKKRLNPNLSMLGIVINNFDKKNSTHREFEQSFRDLSKTIKAHVFEANIPASASVSNSASRQNSVFKSRQTMPISVALKSLAEEILEILGPGGTRLGRPQGALNIDDDLTRQPLITTSPTKGGSKSL